MIHYAVTTYYSFDIIQNFNVAISTDDTYVDDRAEIA